MGDTQDPSHPKLLPVFDLAFLHSHAPLCLTLAQLFVILTLEITSTSYGEV